MKKIKQFWDWFAGNCQNFGEDFDNLDLLDELDTQISTLGNFSWEVEPGKLQSNALVISPNGDLQLLPKTKEIISYAKPCSGWEYYYAKPPKDWDFIFEYETADGADIQVNASYWDYVLLKYEDSAFGIIVKAPDIIQLQEDDKLSIVEIVLDGVLGEEMRMQLIEEIDIVQEFEAAEQAKGTNIKYLLKHIEQL